MNTRQSDSILGCIVGGAIGDSVGAAFEGGYVDRGIDVFDANDRRLTDDTQLTLATCEAIADAGFAEPAGIAAALLAWFRRGRVHALGASTLKALRDLDRGAHWALSGSVGERSAGNGAAMRIAPLAFLLDPDQDRARVLIRDVCRITHQHDEAYAAALAVVYAIREVTSPERPSGRPWIARVATRLPDTVVRERLSILAEASPDENLCDVAMRYGASGYAAESIPLALLAAQRAPGIGFISVLSQLIAAGGDTDTNASIAGQVAGAELGLNALPQELVNGVPEITNVLAIAQRLAKTVAVAT